MGAIGIGLLLWGFSYGVEIVRGAGIVLAVGGAVRLLLKSARVFDTWMSVPALGGGRVEILQDRIRRQESDQSYTEWPFADVDHVRLETLAYGQGMRRQLVVRRSRTRADPIGIVEGVSFSEIEAELARLGVAVRKPRKAISRRWVQRI
jgi:hypothetical protein